MRLINLLAFLTLATYSQSQIFVKGKITGGDPTTCTATATVSHLNIPINSTLNLYSFASGLPIAQNISISDTIGSICNDAIVPSLIDIDGFYLLTAANGDTLASSSILPTNMDFTISDYVAPSSPVSSDGSIQFHFNSQLLVGFGFSDIFSQNQTSIPYLISQDSMTLTVNNLHNGLLEMFIPSTAVPFPGFFYQFTGYIGDYTNSIVNNNLAVELDIVDSYGGCEGAVFMTPAPSATGVTFTWNEINYDGMSTVYNMCPGYYRVLVEDDLGNNRLVDFTINDSYYNYNDPWVLSQDPTDTLNITIANCDLDYSQPIDSINWSETLLSSNADTSFFELNITLFQDTNIIVVSTPYYLTSDTLVMLAMGFYCDNFKSNNFFGLKVFLSRDGSQSHFVSVEELTVKESLSVFPNPANDIITIEGIDEVYVYDQFGKQVNTLMKGENNIEFLKEGIYFLTDKNKSQRFKLIVLR